MLKSPVLTSVLTVGLYKLPAGRRQASCFFVLLSTAQALPSGQNWSLRAEGQTRVPPAISSARARLAHLHDLRQTILWTYLDSTYFAARRPSYTGPASCCCCARGRHQSQNQAVVSHISYRSFLRTQTPLITIPSRQL